MARVRNVRVYLAALALALLLSGCTIPDEKNPHYPHDAPSGGQTIEEMEASIAALEGIESVESFGEDSLNIKRNTGRSLKIVLDPNYVISDGEAFVTFLAESLWATREGYKPNTYLTLNITTNPADKFSIGEAANAAQWTQPGHVGRPPHEGTSSINIDVSSDGSGGTARWGVKNLKRLGHWPGNVPEPPTDAITLRAPNHLPKPPVQN